MGMARKNKTVEQVVRETVFGKPVRAKRVKTEADIWFEQMSADFVKNGAEHLASVRAKMGK